MFSIATGTDVDALFADWEESLSGNEYPVTQGADDLLERSIAFSGPDIANAKIIVAPASEDGRQVIAFDATLNWCHADARSWGERSTFVSSNR